METRLSRLAVLGLGVRSRVKETPQSARVAGHSAMTRSPQMPDAAGFSVGEQIICKMRTAKQVIRHTMSSGMLCSPTTYELGEAIRFVSVNVAKES